MESTLGARVREILERGGGEVVGDLQLVPLVTLESGARHAIDGTGRWVLIAAERGTASVIDDANVHLLHEALEWKRDRFDEAIERAARGLELPEEELLFSYPTTALVRAILATRSSYLTRLALAWLRTTELRALREAIVIVSRDPTMPAPIKEFAVRLIVPL